MPIISPHVSHHEKCILIKEKLFCEKETPKEPPVPASIALIWIAILFVGISVLFEREKYHLVLIFVIIVSLPIFWIALRK